MKSNNPVAVIWLIVFSTFHLCISLAHAAPIFANPNAEKKVDARVFELLTLCSGTEFKDSVRNPTCKGWWLTDITEAPNTPDETAFYLGQYSDECTIGSDGNLRCFFRFPRSACKAWTAARQVDTGLSSEFKKVCGCGEFATNSQGSTVSDVYNCAWCAKNELGCSGSGTQYFDKLKCSGGQHTINLSPIPPEAYHSYCSLEVSGPYSDFSDTYMACGAMQNETFPGLVFTLDQKRQLREINRSRNEVKKRGALKSDLAGFCYPKPNNQPCIKNHPTKAGFCVEPGADRGDKLLTMSPTNKPHSAQVHHVIPKSDARNSMCPCGSNSFKNAVIISAQLNRYFFNKDRTTFKADCDTGLNELQTVNNLPKYVLRFRP